MWIAFAGTIQRSKERRVGTPDFEKWEGETEADRREGKRDTEREKAKWCERGREDLKEHNPVQEAAKRLSRNF